MLITKQEIIDIAYISATITVDALLDAVIATAQMTYLREAMTASLYDDLVADPTKPEYAALLADYVKPFLAFAVKSILFYQQMYEGGTSPTADDKLVYNEIFLIAKSKYNLLQGYCASNSFSFYTQPTHTIKSGFLIKN